MRGLYRSSQPSEPPSVLSGFEQLRESVGASHVKSPLDELGRRRFLFVTGKGGVGKTTVSAAIASGLAAKGKRVLIAMCHTKERLSAIMGTPPIGENLVQVGPSVWAVNISPEQALREYGEMVIKVKTLSNAVFGNQYVQSFLRAVPGLYEWSMLGKAWFHTTEVDKAGHHRFDVVILDAPATGHGLDMLRVPKVILEVAPPGALRRDAERAWKLFNDPKESGVIVVSLPEEMPTTETVELLGTLDRELHLPVLQLFVNGVIPPLFDDSERDALAAQTDLLTNAAPARAASPAEAAAVAGARRAVRESVQLESMRRMMTETKAPMTWLPFLFDDASTKEGTKILSSHLLQPTVVGR